MLSTCLSQQAAAVPVRTAVCPKPHWFYFVLKGLGLFPGQLLSRGRLERSSDAGGRLVAS